MKNKRSWTIALILTATAGFVAWQNRLAPAANTAPEIAVNPNTVIVAKTPSATPAYEGCAYTWAYHDAPELTDKVNAMVQGLNPKASARASLYGEDCIYADGHMTFGAMETDFYARLPVEDLTNEAELGDWMAQVLPFFAQIPREEIQGNYGFVEFWFEKNETERIVLRVPMQKYKDEAQGKSGAELYKMLAR
jgi:hypothetical protein